MQPFKRLLAAGAAVLCSATAVAAPAFVNGLVIDGHTVDASSGTDANDGRLGFFSDLYYDPQRNEWCAQDDDRGQHDERD